MKTAIAVGMKQEAAIVGAPDNAVVVIGAGDAVKLAADLNAAIDAGCERVLSFGACGALDPSLKAGEIVVGSLVVGGGVAIACDRAWASNLIAATGGWPVVVALAAATVASAPAKSALRLTTGANVVDCESGVAARVAQLRGVKFAMLRAVSDVASQTLDAPAIAGALDKQGGVNAGAVAASILRDPAQLPELAAIGDSAGLAYNALARALADIGVDFGAP